MTKRSVLLAAKIIVAATAWVALGLQLYILIDNRQESGMTVLQAIGRFLIFFTILSNLLVAISLSTLIIAPDSPTGRFYSNTRVLTSIALYIFVVGLVYNVILRNLWHPVGLSRIADELLHVLVPVLYLLFWVWFVPKQGLKWKYCFSWLIFPGIYLVYALTRGYLEGFYAYPFIDLSVLSTGKVILNCAGMLVVFIIGGLLFIGVSKLPGLQKTVD